MPSRHSSQLRQCMHRTAPALLSTREGWSPYGLRAPRALHADLGANGQDGTGPLPNRELYQLVTLGVFWQERESDQPAAACSREAPSRIQIPADVKIKPKQP